MTFTDYVDRMIALSVINTDICAQQTLQDNDDITERVKIDR